VPTCGPSDVIVRVHACALTPDDLDHRQGAFLPFTPARAAASPDTPRVGGFYFAGTVAAVGADVVDLTPGMRVVALASPAAESHSGGLG